MNEQDLIKNINNVTEKIGAACEKCGRNASEIIICAASKMQTAETLSLLDSLNIIHFVGENKVQEFREKYVDFKNMKWHFIGQLQTNKVKYLVGKVQLIHSVDRDALLIEIDRVAASKGITQDILLEVSIAGEENKGGVALTELMTLAEKVTRLGNVKLRGIMSVLPKSDERELIAYFKILQNTYEEIKKRFPNEKIDYLSAGMSGDYELAIQYGANIVRIGSAIFGLRDYQKENI